MIDDAEHLFMCLFTGEMSIQIFCPFGLGIGFFFLVERERFVCMYSFWVQVLHLIHNFKYFLPVCSLFLIFFFFR